MNIHRQSAVVAHIVDRKAGSIGDFTLVDVGASGGIADYWNAFGQTLHAVGFDPLVLNMRKMAAAETRPNVRYEAAFVGCANFDALFPPDQRQIGVDPYPRTSSVRAQELMRMNYVAKYFNEGEEVVWAEQHASLDDYFPQEAELDFLKVDTDGSDLQVLLGADKLLRRGAFLGIVVEAQFQGWPHDYANTFANIDRYLRARGFALYDLDRHRYTRAALPGLFEYDIPAQTLTGQALWGDALYCRDFAHPQYETSWQYHITRERLLKLLALFDLFGLPDCAAELLLARPDLTAVDDRNQLLDLLVRSAGFDGTYEQHMKRFEEGVDRFFPKSYTKPPAPQVAPVDEQLRVTKERAEAAEAQPKRVRAENGQKMRLLDKYRRLFERLGKPPWFK
jgi:FkbM family methyltransferase